MFIQLYVHDLQAIINKKDVFKASELIEILKTFEALWCIYLVPILNYTVLC